MSIIDKISYLLKENNCNQSDLLDYIGVKRRATFTEWKNGTSASYKKYINKIAEFFNVSTDYLLNDKDSAIPKDPTIPTEYQSLINSYKKLSKDNQRLLQDIITSMIDIQTANEKRSEIKPITIRHSLHKVSAGLGEALDDGDNWEDIKVISSPEVKMADYAITIDGESMSPDFHTGDIVLVKEQPEIEIGQVGIFIYNNEGYIKERGKDYLISRNPEFDNIIPTEDSQIICKGLVLGIAERVE